MALQPSSNFSGNARRVGPYKQDTPNLLDYLLEKKNMARINPIPVTINKVSYLVSISGSDLQVFSADHGQLIFE